MIARILDALEKHKTSAVRHEDPERRAWHQRQADRIVERLAKCERVETKSTGFADMVRQLRQRHREDQILKAQRFAAIRHLSKEQQKLVVSADDDGRSLWLATRES